MPLKPTAPKICWKLFSYYICTESVIIMNTYIFFSFFFFLFFCSLFVCFYVNWANFKWCNMQILYSTSRKYLHCDGDNQNFHGEDSHYLLWRMAALWSFSSISGGKCESSRGDTDLILFFDWCNSDIHAHLIKHHLLRESLSEKELILARAGLLEITEEQIEKMTVCPAHRHGLGK